MGPNSPKSKYHGLAQKAVHAENVVHADRGINIFIDQYLEILS
jgi:hypothetical protein